MVFLLCNSQSMYPEHVVLVWLTLPMMHPASNTLQLQYPRQPAAERNHGHQAPLKFTANSTLYHKTNKTSCLSEMGQAVARWQQLAVGHQVGQNSSTHREHILIML
jgi:hypothetical protein